MKRFENFLAGMITAGFICMLVYGLTSCSSSRNGYGCKGKESWNKMVRRINSGY